MDTQSSQPTPCPGRCASLPVSALYRISLSRAQDFSVERTMLLRIMRRLNTGSQGKPLEWWGHLIEFLQEQFEKTSGPGGIGVLRERGGDLTMLKLFGDEMHRLEQLDEMSGPEMEKYATMIEYQVQALHLFLSTEEDIRHGNHPNPNPPMNDDDDDDLWETVADEFWQAMCYSDDADDSPSLMEKIKSAEHQKLLLDLMAEKADWAFDF